MTSRKDSGTAGKNDNAVPSTTSKLSQSLSTSQPGSSAWVPLYAAEDGHDQLQDQNGPSVPGEVPFRENLRSAKSAEPPITHSSRPAQPSDSRSSDFGSPATGGPKHSVRPNRFKKGDGSERDDTVVTTTVTTSARDDTVVAEPSSTTTAVDPSEFGGASTPADSLGRQARATRTGSHGANPKPSRRGPPQDGPDSAAGKHLKSKHGLVDTVTRPYDAVTPANEPESSTNVLGTGRLELPSSRNRASTSSSEPRHHEQEVRNTSAAAVVRDSQIPSMNGGDNPPAGVTLTPRPSSAGPTAAKHASRGRPPKAEPDKSERSPQARRKSQRLQSPSRGPDVPAAPLGELRAKTTKATRATGDALDNETKEEAGMTLSV
ncbi:uncharacterized protein LOC125760250 [Rhipicephalus sanguineus]|uniref:uncharacterized protein LOC125760250 n=1 Tax=Rhipicephalus sanguineus TaxID=34632 RepID=UPI0020C56D27|nr:uncharacterized protein LOC125760250 [Rhipicephalus sanguineus]